MSNSLQDIKDIGFIRRAIVGTIGYFHENIFYLIDGEEDLEIKNMPVAFQKNGNSQWMYDNFNDKDLDCGGCYINGETQSIPSAIISFDGGIAINFDYGLAANSPIIRETRVKSEFIGDKTEDQFTRIKAWLPFEINLKLKFKASNMGQALIITEFFFDQHHKRRLFKHSYRGINNIPVEIEVGDGTSLNLKTNYKVSEGSDSTIEFEIPIKLIAYYPSINTAVDYRDKIKSYKATINPK